jgi:mono/diheme cytochrome c family protein/glucose/arabinose dehydrogenase/lysophospholipase L1-like esterase
MKSILLTLLFLSPLAGFAEPFQIQPESRIVFIGGGLGARMMPFGHFETTLHQRYPTQQLFIRNMCDEGDTPGFRPHSARNSPWAYPGAQKFRTLSDAKDRWGSGHTGNGFYKTPDEWLTTLKPDVIIGFFGYSESFEGPNGLENFKAELTGLIEHTQATAYNAKAPAEFILVSPAAFQDLSKLRNTPDGVEENINLALYTDAMKEVANANKVHFVDLFSITKKWFNDSPEPLTQDGALFTSAGYAKLAPILADGVFGESKAATIQNLKALENTVSEKNWLWQNFYKIPNGVHVFGRRHNPYGPKNYPFELIKLDQMLNVRDQAIWASLSGKQLDVAAGDAKTDPLPDMGKPSATYLPAEDTTKKLTVPDGYKIELFASNDQFPDLANPVQMSFDNKGRLWIATMPSYPHYKPGDTKPNDKLLIFEDTNNDGKADKQIVFADGLHLPMGFEFGANGVFVSQGYTLIHLRDTDGDDHADEKEIVMSGFDDHDTHHAISAFCADPSGAFYMGEGTFLHSNVETAYGTIRSSNGGFFRYNPARRHLERSARLSIPNPWGIAFDEWGQNFFADTSDPDMRWMLPGTVRVGYGNFAPNPPNLLSVKVRPTSGLEVVSSRHFPDEVQGDILINNTIGFLGTKQHTMEDDGTGYKSSFRQDLVKGSDPNFRPVDMEFAPDGSLYLVDWHNALIGHMQHNARDPDRDHEHGRVFRITYPGRPLVKPAQIAGASIPTLLENLKLPEYRTRYRTRRELRERNADDVIAAIKKWSTTLSKSDPNYEHQLVEALWVCWGLNRVNEAENLLKRLLTAKDYRARAAAVHVLRYSTHQIPDHVALLRAAAADEHGRVKMEAIATASWLGKTDGLSVLDATDPGDDSWLNPVYATAKAYLQGQKIEADAAPVYTTHLTGQDKAIFDMGAEVFNREGHCITCHQPDGKGLPAAQFPPLEGSEWVTGNEERLIKLTLHGLYGPIEVKGQKYPGIVPMTPFKNLSDNEIAAVLTFVRNTFSNKGPVVLPETVKKVRAATADQPSFYKPDELLKANP